MRGQSHRVCRQQSLHQRPGNRRPERDITLPPAQENLLKAVSKANTNTVLVVTSSYPFALNWAKAHIPAIIYSAHGGQEAGSALADILY
ncbi:glycoside hydrolase family 3 protein, partial [Bacillus sp. LR--39]